MMHVPVVCGTVLYDCGFEDFSSFVCGFRTSLLGCLAIQEQYSLLLLTNSIISYSFGSTFGHSSDIFGLFLTWKFPA